MAEVSIARTLLEQLNAIARRLPASRVRRLHLPPRPASDCGDARADEFCALELDDGAFGLAFLLLDDTALQALTRHASASRTRSDPLAGVDPLQLAAGLTSANPVARTLGLAAANALTRSAWLRLGYEPPPAGNSLGDLELTASDHLGMIGAFVPLVREVQPSGARLTIVELDAHRLPALQAEFPWACTTLERDRIAGCNKVIGTSTMLLNGTLAEMLAACPAATEFAVIGPSAGAWPDPMFERGVTRLAGTLIVDGEAFTEAMARGAPWRGAARKFAIDRATWPGWRSLLTGGAPRRRE